jgi:hypothetical protein
MPYLRNTSLTLPFRFRSQSDPTPLTPRSFIVDRTSTKHTVFDMYQLDGASDSKPSKSVPERPPSPPGRINTIKKRYTAKLKAKKRTSSVELDGKDAPEGEAPLQEVSPRVTDLGAPEPEPKQSPFSFKKRHSAKKSIAVPTNPASIDQIVDEEPSNEGRVPVRNTAYQSPVRQSLAFGSAMPASPTRETALTSHPVAKHEAEHERGAEPSEMPEVEALGEIEGCGRSL